jgi:hypothetical protein
MEIENYLSCIPDHRRGQGKSYDLGSLLLFSPCFSFALNLMRFNKIDNISLALYDNALSLDRVLDYRGF